MRLLLVGAAAGLAVALALAPAGTARAHHRQTPEVVTVTSGGDADLPRLPAPGRKAIVLPLDGGSAIAVSRPFRLNEPPAIVFEDGSNQDPAIGTSGKTVAWATDADPLGSGAPGTQIVAYTPRGILQVAVDPSGTSANAALDTSGTSVAFDSTADLAATGSPAVRRVFLQRLGSAAGTVPRQLSTGAGTSRRPTLGPFARLAAFESSSDPVTGADTGVAQIWTADLVRGTTLPRTAGAGPSQAPCLSNDGRVVAFESRADLLGDGHDTGVLQVYALDLRENRLARVTDEPAGCEAPAVVRVKRDWRIAYRCAGEVFFTMLVADTRARVDAGGDPSARLLPMVDDHFVLVASTADLAAGGVPGARRIFMVNIWKRPPEITPGAVVWSGS